MRREGRIAAFLLMTAGVLVGFSPAVTASRGTVVAVGNPRCNYVQAGILERRVRDDARRASSQTPDGLGTRYTELSSIIREAQIERDILHEVCASSELLPIDDQLAGVIAWALVQQSDVAGKRFSLVGCLATANGAQRALLADAWYALASTFNTDGATPGATPTPASLVRDVVPEVRVRAAAVGLSLPRFADATEYWRDTITSQRVAPCSSAAPSPR
jgi:hypothetical protein